MELLWTIELEAEIESDLSVFHRIDDPMALPASRYYGLAELLPAYDGAVRRRFEAILRESEGPTHPAPMRAAAQPVKTGPPISVLAASTGGHGFPGIEYRG